MSRAFQFKQFKINQKHAAMKVGTDSVLLGAWVSTDKVKSILDIGCGTALLSLMLAQRISNAKIVALEIDKDALIDAEQNIQQSDWNSRIELLKGDFMASSFKNTFDLVITNPPYFTFDTASPIEKRSMARNGGVHSFFSWLLKAKEIVTNTGKIAFVLPFDQWQEMEYKLETEGIFLSRICRVKPKHYKDFHRVLVELVLEPTSSLEETSLTIENEKRHDYTDAYKKLTDAFYLDKD